MSALLFHRIVLDQDKIRGATLSPCHSHRIRNLFIRVLKT